MFPGLIVHLQETWLGNNVSWFNCPPLGNMARKQCFLVCPPSGNMARKQCLLVCPPSGNMVGEQFLVSLSSGNTAWKQCFLINIFGFAQSFKGKLTFKTV